MNEVENSCKLKENVRMMKRKRCNIEKNKLRKCDKKGELMR